MRTRIQTYGQTTIYRRVQRRIKQLLATKWVNIPYRVALTDTHEEEQ
jgi:hypothetical protein